MLGVNGLRFFVLPHKGLSHFARASDWLSCLIGAIVRFVFVRHDVLGRLFEALSQEK